MNKDFPCWCNYDAKCPCCGSCCWLRLHEVNGKAWPIGILDEKIFLVLKPSFISGPLQRIDECVNCGAVVS